MGKLKTYWTDLNSSLWFVPSLMILGAIGLAYGLVEFDAGFRLQMHEWIPRFFGVSAEGSRTILSAIAGSMITVAGVTFSMTIVTLSLAASQYTPRLLRTFMRDRGNQVVLGTFVSIFVYCLIVLRTIKGDDDGFVPAIAVVTAILLAICGIMAFIYFIHHVAGSIQADRILAEVARETREAITTIFPEELGHGEEDADGVDDEMLRSRGEHVQRVCSSETGYIQTIDEDSLLKILGEADCVLKLERSVGDFVAEGAVLGSIHGMKTVDKETVRKLDHCFGVDPSRSIEQDPGFGIRQIVDIALKALSPSMNDPTTAKNCLDYLGVILRTLARQRIPSPVRYRDGQVRVVACGPTFESLVNQMFNEIRQNGCGSVSVVIRMLDTVTNAAPQEWTSGRRQVLWKHVQLVSEYGCKRADCDADREIIRQHARAAAEALKCPSARRDPSPPRTNRAQ